EPRGGDLLEVGGTIPHLGAPERAVRAPVDRRRHVALAERGERLAGRDKVADHLAGEEIALAEHVDVDLRVTADVLDLAFGLDVDVRATHDDERLGPEPFRDTG